MASPSETSEDLLLLDSLEDHQQAIIDLLKQARNSVYLFSCELNVLLFNSSEVSELTSNIARRSSNSDVRLLITQPQVLVDQNHSLLHLARRLPSKIKIQKLTIDPPNSKAFMVVDTDKMWLQHDEAIMSGDNTGFANFSAQAEVKAFTQTFNDLWRYSESDVRLRALTL